MQSNPISAPVDFIILAGARSPGIAEVTSGASKRKWMKRTSPLQIGSALVFSGRELITFEVRITLLTKEHWDAWHAWKAIVMKLPAQPGTRKGPGIATAMDIHHPIVNELGVTSCVVDEVSAFEQSDTGAWSVRIKFLEFCKPVFIGGTVEGSRESPRPERDPIDLEIEEDIRAVRILEARLAEGARSGS